MKYQTLVSNLIKVDFSYFLLGIVRLQDEENDPETQKNILKTLQESPHFKKTEQEIKSEKSLVVAQEKNLDEFTLPHPIWSNEEVCWLFLSRSWVRDSSAKRS